MATSTKVQFALRTLQEKAIENINFQIAQAELKCAAFDDEETLAQKVAEWRAYAEAAISNVFHKLGGENPISDGDLSSFKLKSMPKVDYYDKREAQRRVEDLRVRRNKIEAKSQALVPDADGNVSLTKTQLADFFGL